MKISNQKQWINLKSILKVENLLTKSLQYLDGILKIPFSIYKKEKILSF